MIPKLSVFKPQTCGISYSFWELGIQEQLDWKVLAQGFHEIADRRLSRVAVTLLTVLQAGCWLQASAPYHMGLSFRLLECPTHKNSGREQEGPHIAFYNLVPQVTYQHFCHTLFISSKSLNQIHTQGVYFAFGKEECQRICGYILNPTHHIYIFFPLRVY